MKKYLSLIMGALFVSLVVFSNCGGGDDDAGGDSPIQIQADMLTGTAYLTSVSKPAAATDLGWAASGDMSAFTIVFTANLEGGTYTASNVPADGGTVWPGSGTFTWNNETGTQILRNDGVVIDLGLSDTNLALQFTISTASSARAGVIDGAWDFEMVFAQ